MDFISSAWPLLVTFLLSTMLIPWLAVMAILLIAKRERAETLTVLRTSLLETQRLLHSKDAIAYAELTRAWTESETQLAAQQDGTRYYTGDARKEEDLRLQGELEAEQIREQEELDAAVRRDLQ